jgi:pimeloyl-ACP methyl ester carboxylesterase
LKSEAVDLPFRSFAGDVECVISAIASTAPPVMVVGHSYGGAVITAAGSGGQGHPGACHLVYLAALMQDLGDTMDLTPTPGMSAIRVGEDGSATLDPDKCIEAMYHRCPPDTAAWAVSNLRPMRLAEDPGGAVIDVPWKTRPSTYVVCTDDRAIHPDDQRRMAKRAQNSVEIDADHSPFFSQVKLLASVVEQVALGL